MPLHSDDEFAIAALDALDRPVGCVRGLYQALAERGDPLVMEGVDLALMADDLTQAALGGYLRPDGSARARGAAGGG